MKPDDISKWLRMMRLRHDLTQAELGQKLGKSERTVRAWEAGVRKPDGSSMVLLRQGGWTNETY
jgi:DNA-binding transcriptional regulator YiaG